jgi:hypothetical protein
MAALGVVDRVACLVGEPPTLRGRWVWPFALLAAAATVSVLVACHDMEHVFEALQRLR